VSGLPKTTTIIPPVSHPTHDPEYALRLVPQGISSRPFRHRRFTNQYLVAFLSRSSVAGQPATVSVNTLSCYHPHENDRRIKSKESNLPRSNPPARPTVAACVTGIQPWPPPSCCDCQEAQAGLQQFMGAVSAGMAIRSKLSLKKVTSSLPGGPEPSMTELACRAGLSRAMASFIEHKQKSNRDMPLSIAAVLKRGRLKRPAQSACRALPTACDESPVRPIPRHSLLPQPRPSRGLRYLRKRLCDYPQRPPHHAPGLPPPRP